MTTHKIILCQGIQGTGKSTWARKWVQEEPERRVRWNNDDFRNLMGKYWVPSREFMVNALRKEFLHRAMQNGYDIVDDDMNLNPKTVNSFKELVNTFNNSNEDYHYVLEYKLFNTPLDVCIDRDSKRANPIGASIITDTYNRYKDLIDKLNEEYNNS